MDSKISKNEDTIEVLIKEIEQVRKEIYELEERCQMLKVRC